MGEDAMEELRHTTLRTPHDEAFKKLLQTFFSEFLALFFPDLHALLDHSQARFLMQELHVDIVGEEARTLDLLIETRYRTLDITILLHLEPQSSHQKDFRERMFIYFGRLFERHRKEHKLIVPIAIFTSDNVRDEPDTFVMQLHGHEIVKFQFLKLELCKQNWRKFIDSDNPVAAALLAKMGYNEKDRKEMRMAYLRMLLRLGTRLDEAKLRLVMSVSDLYFKPDRLEDEAMLLILQEQNAEGAAKIMELRPAFEQWAYEDGMAKGLEQGIEQGMEQGMEKGRQEIIRKLLDQGLISEEIAAALEASVDQAHKPM